jgi:exopolysaccharide production protein ExoZ
MKGFIQLCSVRKILVLLFLISFLIITVKHFDNPFSVVTIRLQNEHNDVYDVFYDIGKSFNGDDMARVSLAGSGEYTKARFLLPRDRMRQVRFDPGNRPGVVRIKSITLGNIIPLYRWGPEDIVNDFLPANDIGTMIVKDDAVYLQCTGIDPYIVSKIDFDEVYKRINRNFKIQLYSTCFLLLVVSFLLDLMVEKGRFRSDKLLSNNASYPIGENKNGGIQILRAVACLCVLFQHATYYACLAKGRDFPDYLKIGFGQIGVYIFFIISGYVIALSIKQRGKFILYRFLRIYPPYWMAVFFSFIILTVLSQDWNIDTISFFLVPSDSANNSYRIPYWTLIYEMVFYVIMYACILVGFSKNKICLAMCFWMGLIAIFDVYKSADIVVGAPGRLIILSPLNLLFAMGVILAIKGTSVIEKFPNIILFSVFFCFWNFAEYFRQSQVTYFILLGISYSFLLVLFRKFSGFRPLQRVGDASYGIYLVHVIIICSVIRLLQNGKVDMNFYILWPALMVLPFFIGLAYGLMEYSFYRHVIKKYLLDRIK